MRFIILLLLQLSDPALSGPKYATSPSVDFAFNRNGGDYTTTIDPSTDWGRWEGWGVSLCWWANVLGQRDDLADLVFSTKNVTIGDFNLPGLGLNIARYNAGGSGWETYFGKSMAASPSIPHWKQIQGFWNDWGSDDPTSASYNWTVDTNQVAMLKKARDRGANHLELFSNSPMWWMLYNHNPSGADTGSNDNLATWNYGNHSLYLATIAAYAKEHWGLEFTSVEPLNEPIADWWRAQGTQEGCHFSHSSQAMCVNHLRTHLDRLGLQHAVVSASDENEYDQAKDTWESFDEATKANVGKVNVHGYQGAEGRRDLLYESVRGKRLWNSEYGDGDGSGMSMASNLNLDFRWLHNTAYCYWQIFDETEGWGLLRFTPATAQVNEPNTKFWVLAHYSRHIRPGMTIIDGGEANTISAYDAELRRLVVITTNYGTSQSVTYDLSKFKRSLGPVTRWCTETATTGQRYEKHQDVKISDNSFVSYFNENTIQTFEIENVEVQNAADPHFDVTFI